MSNMTRDTNRTDICLPNSMKHVGGAIFMAAVTTVAGFSSLTMTSLTTILGLIPLLLATGVGSEIQRPLAAVVVGGLITSTISTLLLLPLLYSLFEEKS